MNLHAWISGRVEAVEAGARAATPGPWEAVVDDHGRGQVDASVWADSISYYVTEKLTGGPAHRADASHIAAHDPATALRRCEADRRILARHCQDMRPINWSDSAACEGCGRYGDQDMTVTDNINECPELLDLAHAHGITTEELAVLDAPERMPRPPETPGQARARKELADLLFPGERAES